ncbi:unnamed protein product [Lampetra fluviatilis]
MDLLGRLVRGALSAVAPGLAGPLQAREVTLADYRGLEPVAREGSLTLMRLAGSWDGLLQPGPGATSALRLFRVSGEPEARRLFALLAERMLPLVSGGGAVWPGGAGAGPAASAQRVLDALREHPEWTAAHLAAHVGLVHAFRHNAVLRDVESGSGGATPLVVAVSAGELACASELLACGARVDTRDARGDTALHLAARRTDPAILQCLCEAAHGTLDGPSGAGETALQEACRLGREDAARVLLLAGAGTAGPGAAGPGAAGPSAGGHAVHTALRHDQIGCVELLLDLREDQLDARDTKHGGSPMHWARSAQAVRLLAARGAALEARSRSGDAPLHAMARKRRHEAALALLTQGAQAETRGAHGDTPLHIAMRLDHLEMIKPLIVFGAQMDSTNDDGETPGLLLARNSSGGNRPVLMEMLHSVGVTRCFPPGSAPPASPASSASTRPGIPARPPPPRQRPPRPLGFDDVVAMATVMAPMLDVTDGPPPQQRRERVLSLDGGGIRGLVLIQMLLALERESGRPVRELFDWVAGTSTGGILALGIVHGKSLGELRALYFRMKDEVFRGGRPYDSAPLDSFLKRELGEHTKMTDVTHPKVLVTAVLADRHPAELHLFRNYTPPTTTTTTPPASPCHSPSETFQALTPPSEQLVWRAARSSGAAPTYFRQMGRFLDGGLLANNPTLDALTELQQHRAQQQQQQQQGCVAPLRAVVLSLGTGRPPRERVSSADVFRPTNPWQLAQSVIGARELGRLMVDCCTDAEGRPVDRARAWCDSLQVPFFRLSPQLREDVALDEVRDAVLVDALWDTQVYLHSQRAQLSRLARLLTADTDAP